MLQAVDPVQLTIPSGAEAPAREFYCAFLGLPEVPKPENLKAKGGIQTQDGLPIPDAERLGFRDRFGNRVELIQRLS